MSRIWAVARHMIAEGIRMKIALVFIGIIVVLVPALPFTVAGDGITLKSRVQTFLAWSLGTVGVLLSVLTVFLACHALSGEISGKHIIMVASKPIPRWQFFVGKWVGIVVLDAGLLLGTGLAVWGMSWYLSTRPTSVPGDLPALRSEVLSARYGARPDKPDFSVLVDERLRKLREEGRLDETISGDRKQALRQQIEEELRAGWSSLPPREGREFAFKGLLVNRSEDGWVHLHLKPTTPTGVDDLTWQVWWEAGDRNDVNTLQEERTTELIAGRFSTIPIPVRAVNADGTLYVRLLNFDVKNTITFEGNDTFTLLYDIGPFHWNLLRALCVVWCRLAFLAAMGLLASSFLSFPVACMGTMLVLLVASASGFLTEAMQWGDLKPSGEDPYWIFGPAIRPIAHAFVWLVPDFSKFDPVGNIVGGEVVPLMWILNSLVVLVLLKGLLLGILGCVILTRRELAQVVV